jgi:hypothetical protein
MVRVWGVVAHQRDAAHAPRPPAPGSGVLGLRVEGLGFRV